MNYLIFIVLASIATIVGVILTYILVMPERKRPTMNKFGAFLHDLFHFKTLLLEKVLRALYMIATYFIIAYGFFNIFNFQTYYSSYYGSSTEWYGWEGLLMMILGPIFIRLFYELSMMFVLLVKNVIQINNKLKAQNNENQQADIFNTPVYTAPAAPAYTAPAAPAYTAPAPEAPANSFCTNCGAALNADGSCPNNC